MPFFGLFDDEPATDPQDAAQAALAANLSDTWEEMQEQLEEEVGDIEALEGGAFVAGEKLDLWAVQWPRSARFMRGVGEVLEYSEKFTTWKERVETVKNLRQLVVDVQTLSRRFGGEGSYGDAGSVQETAESLAAVLESVSEFADLLPPVLRSPVKAMLSCGATATRALGNLFSRHLTRVNQAASFIGYYGQGLNAPQVEERLIDAFFRLLGPATLLPTSQADLERNIGRLQQTLSAWYESLVEELEEHFGEHYRALGFENEETLVSTLKDRLKAVMGFWEQNLLGSWNLVLQGWVEAQARENTNFVFRNRLLILVGRAATRAATDPLTRESMLVVSSVHNPPTPLALRLLDFGRVRGVASVDLVFPPTR